MRRICCNSASIIRYEVKLQSTQTFREIPCRKRFLFGCSSHGKQKSKWKIITSAPNTSHSSSLFCPFQQVFLTSRSQAFRLGFYSHRILLCIDRLFHFQLAIHQEVFAFLSVFQAGLSSSNPVAGCTHASSGRHSYLALYSRLLYSTHGYRRCARL